MVNKILKVGNQIISVGNAVVNTPNPELEVVQMPYTNDVSGYLSGKVEKGELVFKRSDIFEDVEPGLKTTGYAYKAFFLVRDNILHCWVVESGVHALYWYKDGVWTLKGGESGKQRGATAGFTGIRTSTHTEPHEFNGSYAFATGQHFREYGRWPGEWAILNEDNYWDFRDCLDGDQLDDWPYPEHYYTDGDGKTYLRAQESAAVYQDSSGNCYGAMTWQASGVFSDEMLGTNWGGKGNFGTYSIDPETKRWTKTNHDNASPHRYPYALDFIEVSGSVYLVMGGENLNVRDWENLATSDATDPRYPGVNHYTSYTIYKWNPSTSNWDFHQYQNDVYRGLTFYNTWSHSLDASTHIFEVRGSGGQYMYSPLRFNGSTGYFEAWGRFDTSALPIGGGYASKTFKANGNYYMLVGGGTEHRYTLEGSGLGYTPGSTGQNNDYINNGTYEEEKYSLLRLYKYNSSTDKWEWSWQDDLTFRMPRVSPGVNQFNRQYVRGVDVYEYNGEIHMVACGDSYSQDAVTFYKFDPDTETVTKNMPPAYMEGRRSSYMNYGMDDITQNGIIYRVSCSNDYPYMVVHTYDISGEASGTWKANKYMPDTIQSYCYMPRWYETSSGDLFVFAAQNNGGASYRRLIMYQYDKDLGQLKKVAEENKANISIDTNKNYYYQSKIFSFGDTDYYWIGTYSGDLRLYEVTVDASGLPVLNDASGVTLPTPQGGNLTAYGSDHLYMKDDLLWYCRNAYDAPYHGPEVYTWDGTASSFTEIPVEGSRWATSAANTLDPIRNTNFMSRSRGGSKFFEINNEFWMWTNQEQWPPIRLYKYDSSSSKFIERNIGGYAHRPTTHINDKVEVVVKDNKAWWIDKFYNEGQQRSVHLFTFDGSTIERYNVDSLLSKAYHNFDFYGHLYLNHNNEIEYFCSPNTTYHGKFTRIKRLNQNVMDYGGSWNTDDEGGNLNSAIDYGVALESGNKGDIIQIRRIGKS